MLYENYKKKMQKRAEISAKLKKFRIPAIIFVALALTVSAVLMAVSGLVYDKTDCPATVLYGDKPDYEAGAVFGKTVYEYCAEGSDEWSETIKFGVGGYKVRAVSKTIAGLPRYGKTHAFTVVPRPVEVYADEKGFTYGEEPSFTGDTAYGDEIVCTGYGLEYPETGYALVTPREGCIKAVDEAGADVSDFYEFTPVEKSVVLSKRKITVNVADKRAVYDGTALTSDEYSLDPSTTLAEGDGIKAVFTAKATEAGRHPNMPQITLYHGDRDVTEFYETRINAGELIIEKKLLEITSGNGYKTYDGEPLSCPEYALNAGYSAVKGHSLAVKESSSVTDAGEYENLVTLAVYDARGKDVTDNYNILCNCGTLEISPLPVTLTPRYAEKIYDGKATAEVGAVTADGSENALLSGHIAGATVSLDSADVGESVAQIISVSVVDGDGKCVTDNYSFTYGAGIVKTLPRPVTLKPSNPDKVYDGTGDATVAVVASPSSEYPLASGHTAEAKVVTSQIDVGTGAAEIISARVLYGKTDVTKNYTLSFAQGTITVVPRPVTVVTGDGEWVYDGKEHFEESADCADLVSGHTINVLTKTVITDAGTKENKLTVAISSGTAAVTNNYVISYGYGTLKVVRRPVTIVAGSEEKVYDGLELTAYYYAVSRDTPLADGHGAGAKVYGSQTDAGESLSVVEQGKVWDFSSEHVREVTENYEFSYVYGKLKVTRRPVTVYPASVDKRYDGTPLTTDEVWGDFVYGHTATARTTGLQTQVGESANDIVAGTVVIKSNGRDVTSNYEIKAYGSGVLTVQYPWTFAYTTKSVSKIYDGEPLTAESYEITKALPEGFRIDEVYFGSAITECGQMPNAVSFTIRDDGGNDVTRLVYTETVTGTLTVLPRPVTVVTNGHSWEYDGKAHSDDGFEIADYSEYKLLGNHTAVSGNPAEIINVGEMFNSMEISVSDGSGFNVTENYEFIFDYGVLKVTGTPHGEDPDGTGGSGGSSSLDKSGDIGSDGSGGGSGGEGGEAPVRIYTDKSGEVYLKLMSFGNYDGRKWLKAADYTGRAYGKYGMAYLTGNAFSWYGYGVSHMTLDSPSGDYVLPYYISPDSDESAYRVQTGDVYYQGDTRVTYSVDYYDYDYFSIFGPSVGGQFADAELDYRAFVYSKYLNVPVQTRAYMQSVINLNGWTADTYGIVPTVAKYVRGAASYNLNYDARLDNQPDIAVAFLRDYKEGVCRHYATVATLLFRTLGIPARYTIGYAAAASAGEWTYVTGDDAHAWVEVYIDGAGWIKVEVTGGGPGGGFGGTGGGTGGLVKLPERLILRPADAAKTYDGTPLTPTALEMNYDLKRLVFEGYTYKCGFGGSLVETGQSWGYVTDFELFDPRGRKVNDISYDYYACTLTVTDGPVVTVHPYGVTKIYDGMGRYYRTNDYYITGLPPGYTAFCDLSGIGLRGAGIITRYDLQNVKVRVYQRDGREITDGCYILWDTSDLLTVFERRITLTAASSEKLYDGKPLTDGGYYITSGSLAYGHTLEVAVEGSVTDVGTVKNIIKRVVIRDGYGKDVTANYDVITLSGELTVLGS